MSQIFSGEESIVIEYAKLLRLLRLRSLDLNFILPAPMPIVLHEFGRTIQKIRELRLCLIKFGLGSTALSGESWRALSEEPWRALSEESWRALTDQLALSEIEKLDLRYNWLSSVKEPVWRLLGQAFSHMKHLKRLDLRDNRLFELNSESRELLATGLMRNPNSPTLIIDAKDDPDDFWKEKMRFGSFKISIK